MSERQLVIRGQVMNLKVSGREDLPTIVFLHGFTGSVSTWQEVWDSLEGSFRLIAVDLMGHGKSAKPSDASRYEMAAQLADLDALFAELKLNNFTLVGYSMGGRIALAYTREYPDHVKSLILESTSPGLRTAEERALRVAADLKLAKRIEAEGIEHFVDFWEQIPLFQSQRNLSVEVRRKVREERLGQDEKGLSRSLQGIGTGSQPSYWSVLGEMTCPILLITGEIDGKFVGISREMKNKFPSSVHEIVKNAGHAIHVEKPTLFATMIKEHMIKIQGGN